MADKPARKKTSLGTFLAFALVMLVLIDPNLRDMLGNAVGIVLEPLIGFNGQYPILTVFIAGSLMVLLTTLMRHFTTDWLEMARTQNHMRAFQKEFSKARKENNTYRIKQLQDKQPEIMQMQQEMSSRQLKSMPMTMIIVIPLFAWLVIFLQDLQYTDYSAPWNLHVHMFGTTVLPHWILLYSALSIPVGALVQKAMKYLSWKERWKGKHPEVHE
jgi:uncharacterized membrane protein (DUF106 family)